MMYNLLFVRVLVLGSFFALASCGGGGEGSDENSNNPPVIDNSQDPDNGSESGSESGSQGSSDEESTAPEEEPATPEEEPSAPIEGPSIPVEEPATPEEEPATPEEEPTSPEEEPVTPEEEPATPEEEPASPEEEPASPEEEPASPEEEPASPEEEPASPEEEPVTPEEEPATPEEEPATPEEEPVTPEEEPVTPEEIEPTESELIALAIAAGDSTLLPEDETALLDEILALIGHYETDENNFLAQIYGEDSISYSPHRNSQFVSISQREGMYALVRGNKGLRLATASEIDGQRNAAFGTNIVRNFYEGSYLSYENHFKKLLAWLLKRDDVALANAADIRLALMDSTTYSRTTAWLNTHYPNWVVTQCDEALTLNTCLGANADLVITASNTSTDSDVVATALANAQAQGAARIYVHNHSWNTSSLTNTVLAGMNFSMQTPGNAGNYYSQDTATWNNYQEMFARGWNLEQTRTLINNFKAGSFPFDLSTCASSCEAAYSSEFYNATNALRSTIKKYDNNAVDLFASPKYSLEKMLVLLGDVYRQSITYPMDVSTTDQLSFLQAWYADHTVYNHRDHNPVQSDLGNFSRTDFTHINPSNKTVSLISKKNFRSAGVYALPGQTFTVTRNDHSDLNVSIFINSLRSSSTKQFENNKYVRPKYLWSASVPIKAGETIRLTSPYGGPVQINFSSNDLPVELSFTNIGLHPHWASSADNESFAQSLDAGDYDWAEVVTPQFEIHSRLSKMRSSLSGSTWVDAVTLAAGTEQYMHNYPHVLAGFQGPGIDVVDEIHDFAGERGWTINNLDLVKHMNADQPTCGSGCSGNPYDASWQFNPIGHGDIHELGHGLENGKFRFYGWESHAVTNPYSYYSKTQYAKINDTGSSCQSLPFDRMFGYLKESISQADPFTYMENSDLKSWDEGVAIYVQMMMAAQAEGALADGWNMYARLHVLYREFGRADDNESNWLAKRDSLGFGNYSRTDARALSNNDWLLIAISSVTERDYRDFFTMWGLSFSTAAADQVAALNYPAVATNFYQASGNNYCLGLDKTAIAIIDSDGDGVIDSEDAFPNNPDEQSDADGDGTGDNADTEFTLDPVTIEYQNMQLVTDYNSQCLSISPDADLAGQSILLSDCSDKSATSWTWTLDGRLHLDVDLGYCVQASGSGNTSSITLALCSDNTKQQWNYDSDTRTIRLQQSNNSTMDYSPSRSKVHVYGYHGNSNQRWTILTAQ